MYSTIRGSIGVYGFRPDELHCGYFILFELAVTSHSRAGVHAWEFRIFRLSGGLLGAQYSTAPL